MKKYIFHLNNGDILEFYGDKLEAPSPYGGLQLYTVYKQTETKISVRYSGFFKNKIERREYSRYVEAAIVTANEVLYIEMEGR